MFVFIIILVVSFFFVQDIKKCSLLGIQVFFFLGILGFFCFVFVCVVKFDFFICVFWCFFFGVLFVICFFCLVVYVFVFNFLIWKNYGFWGWVIFIVVLLLILVEVIINIEWLIIILVWGSGDGGFQGNSSVCWVVVFFCVIVNMDFVMVFIYVMLLLLGVFLGVWFVLCGYFKCWCKYGVFVLFIMVIFIVIWVVWIVMYIYGNEQYNSFIWDDFILVIVFVVNVWVFVFFYVIFEVFQVIKVSLE